MARLTVKHQGEEIAQLGLEPGREYVAGRSSDAQIVLPNHKGISRHHLKFYERDGGWICETLSKFVLIQKGSESLEVVELRDNAVFTVGPFEIQFAPTSNEAEVAPEAEASPATPSEPVSKNLPAFYNPNEVREDTTPRANNEATMAGVSAVVPYFRISYPNTADDEVLKLEGQLWTAGRDPSCEIFVDSPHISRKHFEMAHTNEGFFVTDLGSSNGTKINGNKIPPHEPTRVESGDTISVMSVDMLFEIRDTQFPLSIRCSRSPRNRNRSICPSPKDQVPI
jgi:pSer/pThr/pTyr-binding forkhead associated (FHA) protein